MNKFTLSKDALSPPAGVSNELWEQLLRDEDRKVACLRGAVDSAILKIMNSRMTRQQALDLVLQVRSLACELFPNSASTFDLIYLSRFRRVIDEYTTSDAG